MPGVKLQVSGTLTPSDPVQNAVLIVGQTCNLKRVSFDTIKVKFGSKVSEGVRNICYLNYVDV